jgi:hypothetical protein
MITIIELEKLRRKAKDAVLFGVGERGGELADLTITEAFRYVRDYFQAAEEHQEQEYDQAAEVWGYTGG